MERCELTRQAAVGAGLGGCPKSIGVDDLNFGGRVCFTENKRSRRSDPLRFVGWFDSSASVVARPLCLLAPLTWNHQ